MISIHFISRHAIMASLIAASASLSSIEELSRQPPNTSLRASSWASLQVSLVSLGKGGHAIITNNACDMKVNEIEIFNITAH